MVNILTTWNGVTEMLRILPYNSVMFDKGIVIGDAYDVRVTYEINGERRLDFSHPINEKSEIISENKIVVCEGQAYRIIKVTKTIGEKNFITTECSHVYSGRVEHTYSKYSRFNRKNSVLCFGADI